VATGSLPITIRATDLPGRTCGPYQEIEVGLQVGREAHDSVPADANRARWSTVARVVPIRSGGVGLRGPAIHGRGEERFLYLVWRAKAAKGPEMFRRAKLQLDAVPPAMIFKAVSEGLALVADLPLTDHCGAPLCASVRPPIIRWSTASVQSSSLSGSIDDAATDPCGRERQ
jgi:hypothetical protein